MSHTEIILDNTFKPGARMIRDSIANGVRLSTMAVTMHRWVLAEFNTHRVFTRSSASSRAIPLSKQLALMEQRGIAFPVSWPKEQKGMQGGDEFSDDDIRVMRDAWEYAAKMNIKIVQALHHMGLHKSVINRLLEPFMFHEVIVTSTAFDNFFFQRCSELAQPEIRVAAESMQDCIAGSEPQELTEGMWHTPFIDQMDMKLYLEQRLRVSAARCARASYMTHHGTRDIGLDLDLYHRLRDAQPTHWAPFEHVATPWAENVQDDGPLFEPYLYVQSRGNSLVIPTGHLPKVGNLLKWRSLRTEEEAMQRVRTYA